MSERIPQKTVKRIKVDLDKCLGCRACEVACSGFHLDIGVSSQVPVECSFKFAECEELVPIHVVEKLLGRLLLDLGFLRLRSNQMLLQEVFAILRGVLHVVDVDGRHGYFHGQRFFVRLNGVLHATPLFVALLFVEATDIIFAVDSVPAIYALTDESLIVFTSNVFAILGLRSLYFVLARLMGRFEYLHFGLAAVLAFIGAKMLLSHWLHVPSAASLGVVIVLLGASMLYSVWKTARNVRIPGLDQAGDQQRP